jgi:hypothetical protein
MIQVSKDLSMTINDFHKRTDYFTEKHLTLFFC